MAKVIELKAGAVPPKDDDWAMVVVHRPGIEAQGSVVRHNRGATFYTPATAADVERAIGKAIAWADAHSVAVVYLCRDV